MENRNKRELAKKRLILHSVLCVLLPPVGMLLVWRNRYKSQMKLLMTFVSTLVLMLMFSIGMRLQPPEDIVPTPMSAGYMNQGEGQSDSSGAFAPANPAAPATPNPNPVGDDFVAPADPQG